MQVKSGSGTLQSPGPCSPSQPHPQIVFVPPLTLEDTGERQGLPWSLGRSKAGLGMDASSPHTRTPVLPTSFLSDLFTKEKSQRSCTSSSSVSNRGGFPGETEGTWEAGGGALLLQGTGGVREM